jgi:hypothetical protein
MPRVGRIDPYRHEINVRTANVRHARCNRPIDVERGAMLKPHRFFDRLLNDRPKLSRDRVPSCTCDDISISIGTFKSVMSMVDNGSHWLIIACGNA